MINTRKIVRITAIWSLLSFIISLPVMAKEGAIITITDVQKSALSMATYWKLNIHHDYGKAKKFKGVPIDHDVRRILQYAGWKVVPLEKATFDVVFDVSVKGKARGTNYTTGYQYSGSDVKVSAVLKSANEDWSLTLPSSSGMIGCSFFISRYYSTPDSAPFKKAYYLNRDFFLNLFSIMYQAKGVKPLIVGMNDSHLHAGIRKHLYHYFGIIRSEKLVSPLLADMAAKTGDIKKEVIIALGKIGDKRAVPSLCIALLEDKSSMNRGESAKALAAIGSPKAVSALEKALLTEDTKSARLSIAEALDTLGWHPDSTKEKVFYLLSKKEKRKVMAMGDNAVPVLIESLKHSSGDIRKSAAEILGNAKTEKAVGPLCEMIVNEASRAMRKEAIIALGKIGDPKALPQLCISLLEDKDSMVRGESAKALAAIGSPKAVSALEKALLTEDTKSARLSIAKALDTLGWHPDSTKEKVFYLLSKKKKRKVVAMGDNAVPVLIESLKHSSGDIRKSAAEILGNAKTEKAVGPLCEMIVNEASRAMRKEAIIALGKIGDPKALPQLCISLLEDKDSMVRGESAKALAAIGSPKAVSALEKALLNDKNSRVRESAAEALGKIGDKKVVKILDAQLEKEKDRKVKKAICNAMVLLGSEEKLPIEFRIADLQKQKDWKTLSALLKKQQTETLIEYLKDKDVVLKRIVAEILIERTGNYDLGTNYNNWKSWNKKTNSSHSK